MIGPMLDGLPAVPLRYSPTLSGDRAGDGSRNCADRKFARLQAESVDVERALAPIIPAWLRNVSPGRTASTRERSALSGGSYPKSACSALNLWPRIANVVSGEKPLRAAPNLLGSLREPSTPARAARPPRLLRPDPPSKACRKFWAAHLEADVVWSPPPDPACPASTSEQTACRKPAEAALKLCIKPGGAMPAPSSERVWRSIWSSCPSSGSVARNSRAICCM
jgi:hypothetical protein